MSRREALRRLGAGTLLSLGFWPGAGRAVAAPGNGAFRFIVVNDTHYQSPECGEYLAGAVKQMKEAQPAFCLHAGDLTDQGDLASLRAVKRVFAGLEAPFYPVPGNHDHAAPDDIQAFTEVFPTGANYSFEHGGWQFVGLDTTEGQHYEKTSIAPATLRWLDENLPRLDRRKPTVAFTHFPLGADAKYRPANADDLLDRFREFELRAVFCGHFHGFTESRRGATTITTNRCCALRRNNHDGTKAKGYFVCEARDGQLTRQFVEYKLPPALAAFEGKS